MREYARKIKCSWMHLLIEFWRLINAVRRVKKRQAAWCTHKMQAILSVYEFTEASLGRLFDYDINDKTRNNGSKLVLKRFNTSVAKRFYTIKSTITWNALPCEVLSIRW